jgi:hypothetical protein
MDDTIRAALYARVSSEQQANELTIRSQVAALRQRIAQDGLKIEADRHGNRPWHPSPPFVLPSWSNPQPMYAPRPRSAARQNFMSVLAAKLSVG